MKMAATTLQHRVQDLDVKKERERERLGQSVFLRLSGAKVKVSAYWMGSESAGRSQWNAVLILQNV